VRFPRPIDPIGLLPYYFVEGAIPWYGFCLMPFGGLSTEGSTFNINDIIRLAGVFGKSGLASMPIISPSRVVL